jgi:hypothetical protein
MLRLLHSPAGGSLLALLVLLAIASSAKPAVLAAGPAQDAGCHVCLSQIYGHGGKGSSLYDADYVELFNRSDEAQRLVGWRLDYTDVHSEEWRTVDLSSLLLPPHRYALVGLKRGSSGSPLPQPDVTGNLNLGGDAGKLQLVDAENTLVDLLGYGDAEWAEGAPVPGAAAGAALLRLNGGCRDSDDNASDFVEGQPNPHNSQSPAQACSANVVPPVPAATDTPLPTAVPVATPTAAATDTPQPASTPLPTNTAQPVDVAHATASWPAGPTPAPTVPALPSETPSETPTVTPPPTPIWQPTSTPTASATATPVLLATASADPLPGATATPVGLEEPAAQATASETPTASPVPTETGPPTLTPGVTAQQTPTPAATATTAPPHAGTPAATGVSTPASALTATRVPMPTPTGTPSITATPAATLPGFWSHGGTPSPLQIDEVAYAGSEAEYVVLANVSGSSLALAGWLVGDAERPGDGEGMYALPDLLLAPGALFVVARQADAFHACYGRPPGATLEKAGGAAPQLVRRSDLAGGKLALNDGGDEIVLLAPGLLLADAMGFGRAEYAALGLTGSLHAAAEYTLQRVPSAAFPVERDVRHRFLAAPPRPFEPRGLPLRTAPAGVGLDGGYVAAWGTLGAHSNFTEGYTSPPHYLAAAAAAQGLQFVAIADTGVLARPVLVPPGITVLPAWRWNGGDAGSAVVYSNSPEPGLSLSGLSGNLADSGGIAQWQGKQNPALARLAALAADDGRGEDIAWFFKRWELLRAPLLPAGNAEPDQPGAVAVNPRYTGLAVRGQDVSGLMDALVAGRGWLTSDANAWLTLQAETEGGLYWMGSWLPDGSRQVTLHVVYGDADGEAASLAIWQDGVRLQERILPPSDGRWDVTVSPAPGALLAAVALQTDGDYAVTAPVQLLQPGAEENGDPASVDPPVAKPPGAAQPDSEQGGNSVAAVATLEATYGQAGGPPGSVAQAKLAGLEAEVELRAVVTVPPRLFNGSMYVADVAGDGVTAGIGANVYLRRGEFPPLVEGDRVWLRGRWNSYRGEMELVLASPQDVWKLQSGPALRPLPVWAHSVCESVEGRLVTFTGAVVGWQGDSLLLADPTHPAAEPVRVTVRSSLPWKRPFVYKGEVWQVTGIVSQFARKAPWNGGYRVLPRYVADLVRIE